MNHAAFDDQIDVVVGVNGSEALIDADELYGGRGFAGLNGHALSPTRSSATPSMLRSAARAALLSMEGVGRSVPSRPHASRSDARHRVSKDVKAPLRWALVVGHVVVDLNLARDDVRFRLIGLGSYFGAENRLVVVIDRVVDAALFQAQHKDTRLPVSVLGVHERLVGRDVDMLQHRSQDFAGEQTVLVGIDADAELA